MILFTPKEVKKLFNNVVERKYGPGQIVIYNGDKPIHVMFIKSGAVKFYDIDSEGNEKILHIGGKGSIFPLFYPFEDKSKVDAFYTTICDTEVLLIPLDDFRKKLRLSPQYAFHILRWYAKEMDHVVRRLKSLEKSSAQEKVLEALSYLCNQHATIKRLGSDWYKTNFPVTQQALADMTGLTRETVNVELKTTEKLQLTRNRKQTLEINRKNLTKAMPN